MERCTFVTERGNIFSNNNSKYNSDIRRVEEQRRNDTTFLGVILHEHKNVPLKDYIPSHKEKDDDGCYYSLSDKDRNFNIKDNSFVNGYDM